MGGGLYEWRGGGGIRMRVTSGHLALLYVRGMSCSKPYCKARSSQITLAIRV